MFGQGKLGLRAALLAAILALAGTSRADGASASNAYVTVTAEDAVMVIAVAESESPDFEVVVTDNADVDVMVEANDPYTLAEPMGGEATLSESNPEVRYRIEGDNPEDPPVEGWIRRIDLNVNLILKNMSATVADGATIADMDAIQEEADGAEIRINADFDENNKNAANKPLEDFRPDDTAGHRIIGSDPDLLDGMLKIEGANIQGQWMLIFPAKVKVWKQSGANWIEMMSGTESATITLPLNLPLKVEGVDGSTATKDIEIQAEFLPAGAVEPGTDRAFVTCVKTEFMLTFDDGPFDPETTTTMNSIASCYVNGEKVKAVFFMVGKDDSGDSPVDPWPKEGVDDVGHDAIVQSVNNAGHHVGNHTDTHKHAWEGWLWQDKVSVTDYESEIQACENRISAALGKAPEKIFRPPYWGLQQTVAGYGPYNDNVGTAASNKGYQVIWGASGFGEITWSGWETVAENTLEYLKTKWNTKQNPVLKDKPAILCYHEDHAPIPDSMSNIVNSIRNKGFLLQHFDPARCDADRTYYPRP